MNPMCQTKGDDGRVRHKRTYRNKAEARKAMLHAQTQHGGPALNVYRCPVCAAWHIGHRERAS